MAGVLGFVTLLILQAVILKKGVIGKAILDFLYPFIGLFGICVLIFIMFFLSYMIFFPKNFIYLLGNFKKYRVKLFSYVKNLFKDSSSFSNIKRFFLKDQITEPFKPIIREDLPKNPENKDTQIIFNENKIKISYNVISDKDNEEKKYASMVRLVGENEKGEVREVNVERVLNRNKKFFEELRANHFNDSTSNLKPEAILDNISKDFVLQSDENQILSHLKKPLKENISDIKISIDEKESETILPESMLDNMQQDDNFSDQKEQEENLNFSTENEKLEILVSEKTFQSVLPKQKPLIVKELAENKQLLEELDFGEVEKPKDYRLPSTQLLQMPKAQSLHIDENEIDKKIQDLLSKLKMFKIDGDIARTYSGPIVTTFEFRPAPNVKVSRILTLGDDLAMALCAQSIRIQAPIPGKDVVGIEIPNAKTETIYLREILESDLFKNSTSPLTLALGKDIVGNSFITDLKKLPHLLIAGTTGSGKSVGVNAMILSLLFRNSPDNLKLIMIDPKMVEFSMYADIPHLLTPIITSPKKAISALASAVKEMERRYKIMSECKTKNIDKYNPKAKLEGLEVFPFLVIIIDELADLMMTGGKEAEFPIARIAQMGRAAGLHLIVATQRPSVDVVTGLIKTNLPSRISFKVGSKIDSRVVLDVEGAQSLLGRGDMLFTPPGIGGVVRLHAPWASEEEIEEIVEFIKSQREVVYDKDFLLDEAEVPLPASPSEGGEIIDEAKRIILQDKKTSISYLQRRLGVGYNKAASIIEELQNQGFLSEPNTKGVREIIGR